MSRPTVTGPDASGREADFVIITALEKEARAVIRRLEDCHIERFEDQDIRLLLRHSHLTEY
jgi:hypothetical protein